MHISDRNAGSLEGTVAGSWNLGIVRQSQGEDCCWLRRDRLRGRKGGDCWGECLWRKARQSWKPGDTAESRVGGEATTIASVSPHAGICSWTERLAHQMPDALNRRVGPHPGCFFKWLLLRTAERLYRKPSKCLNGQSHRERLARGLPITSYKRPKKTLTGPYLLQQRQSMSLHTHCHQGPRKPSSCATISLNSHWGRAATGKNVWCLCTQGHFGCVWLFVTL